MLIDSAIIILGAVTFLFATENSKPTLSQFVATLGEKEKAEVRTVVCTTERSVVDVIAKQRFLGLFWSMFNEYRVRIVVLSRHFLVQKDDVPV